MKYNSLESVIIGYSGHAYVVLDVVLSNGLTCKYYCDNEIKKFNPYNLMYGGSEKSGDTLSLISDFDAYLGIGENKIRAKVFTLLKENGINMPFIAHRSSILSDKSYIGEATAIMPGCIINSQARIGKAVICNTGSIVEHECIIGDFVHIAPGAVLAGNVRIGAHSFIGANSVIKQGIKIGEYVTIGAGSVVLKDIEDNCIVYGNPAKQIAK